MGKGLNKAVDAAWRAFGTRYWKVIITLSMLRKSAPVLAALTAAGIIVGGSVWAWRRAIADSEAVPAPTSTAAAPAVAAATPTPDAGRDLVPGAWWMWVGGCFALVACVLAVARLTNPMWLPPWQRPGGARAMVVGGLAAAAFVVGAWLVGAR
ncbi:hypothetical protein [Rhizomonospora bruguierae]|uniref:hypothetical protein n=1 Tax=Rhizomonospora bruguierae TaxID=1581705 RepID=UPI001BD0276C|nr:hypothetical protein [Micromonospora sp. NBRC 107566]